MTSSRYSRQDYELTASILKSTLHDDNRAHRESRRYAAVADAVSNAATRFAETYAADNPRFDRERFLAAAGVA